MTGLCPACGPSSSPADPRRQGTCVRCGRMLTPKVTELHRAGHLDYGDHPVFPDVKLQREFVRNAARSVGVDPSGLLAVTESRTLPGPIQNFHTRDLVLDAREEGADGTNYIPWEYQRRCASGDMTGVEWLATAQAYLTLMWHALDQYEQERRAA